MDHEDIIEMQTNILLLFQVHPSEEVTMEDTEVVWEVLEWTVAVAVIEDQPALLTAAMDGQWVLNRPTIFHVRLNF